MQRVPPRVDQESVEIDDFLDNSTGGSSFLSFSEEVGAFGNKRVTFVFCPALCATVHHTVFVSQTNSEETNVDFPSASINRCVVVSWSGIINIIYNIINNKGIIRRNRTSLSLQRGQFGHGGRRDGRPGLAGAVE